MKQLRVGLIVNPLAGVGGPAGLKGSDDVYDEALARGAVSQVNRRVNECLQLISNNQISWVTVAGAMGGDMLRDAALSCEVIGVSPNRRTTGADTRAAVQELQSESLDLLLFAGGDGTARDVVDVFESTSACLGIPCGVKMHSGVFATTPRAAAEIINKLLAGQLLSVVQAEVRDIDEASFRQGQVKTRFYGELPVPNDLRYLQQTKVAGRESDELVVEEIAAEFIESLQPGTTYFMGSGSTIATVMNAMGIRSTLLGIDVIRDGELIASDASEQELLSILEDSDASRIVITAISGQGHILGRGNQQLSPAVIRSVGPKNIEVLATKSKLQALDQRPLLVDTGDANLDLELSGLWQITTGYEDKVFYRVAS